MGLINALTSAAGGVLADQWLDYFSCDAMDPDMLIVRGQRYTGGRGSNKKGSPNVISNGSGIIVADGQCMIIVDQGEIVEVCAEPGQFTYDSSSEPSVFFGPLGANIVATFKNIGRRFAFGGSVGKDQRVYFFNTKEIIGNKYGTQNPVPFRVVDTNMGLDIDIAIRCNGEYSYKITDPLLFYKNVAGNVTEEYRRDQIDSQLKTELLTALQPAFARISGMGVRYSALPLHTMEIADALNEVLSGKWKELRGIEVASFGVNSVSASKEDEDLIKEMQKNAVMRDPTMAAAALASAQADAMRIAAGNESGAMTGFLGMGFAQGAGGGSPQNLFPMGQQGQAMQGMPGQQTPGMQGQPAPGYAGFYAMQQPGQPTSGIPTAAGGGFAPVDPAQGGAVADPFATQRAQGGAGSPAVTPNGPNGNSGIQPAPEMPISAPTQNAAWICATCGQPGNTGNFCIACGAPNPANAAWRCQACGHSGNTGKFCGECGSPRI